MRSPAVEREDSQLQPDSTTTTITTRYPISRDDNIDTIEDSRKSSQEECVAKKNPLTNGDVAIVLDVAREAGESDVGDSVVLVRDDDDDDDDDDANGDLANNNNSSSVQVTDTSTDEEEESDEEDEEDAKKHGWLTSPNDQQQQMPANQQLQREMNGIALPTSSDPSAYGDISFTNCSAVQVGPRTFYKGPVTIKQFVYTNSSPVSEDKISTCSDGGVKQGLTYNQASANNGAKLSQSSDRPLYPGTTSQRVAEWCSLKRCLISVGAAVFALVLIIVLSIVLTLNSASSGTTYPIVPAHPNDTSINNVPTIPGVHVVKRIEWGAQPPKKPANRLEIEPPPYIIISHTASEFCYTQSQCVLIVRVAQTFHMESRGWDDIGYNFLVGGDGLVYEGRGWGVEGAHTFNYNVRSIGISFIGTFNEVEPTPAQLHAAKKLIEFAEENDYVSKDYKLLGHRQCIKTESPGDKLYNIIKTWEHWSPTPE